MADSAPSVKSDALKRRSTRIVQAVPLTVTGVDALGRPFEERTSTSILNCHGCRYQSKHYVLKNMWITLEVPNPEQGRPPHSVRARVMWIQRPRTVRELFQVGVELEVPGNIWGIAFCPPDWFPFPESGGHVPAPPVAALPSATTEATPSQDGSWSDVLPEEAFTADNVRTMPSTTATSVPFNAPVQQPPTPAPPQPAAQAPAINQEQLRAEVREFAADAVAAEARRLLDSLQTQLREASDKAAQAATSAAADKAVENAMAKSEALADERLRALTDRLNDELTKNLEQHYQKIAAQTSEIDPARRDALVQQLQAQVNEGLSQLQAATTNSQESIEQSRQYVEGLRREMENAVSVALQNGFQQLNAHAQDSQARVAELENVQRQVIDKIGSVFASAEADWQTRLQASTASAASRWDEQLGMATERAAQQISERTAASSQLAHEQFERELGERVANSTMTLQNAGFNAENQVLAARASFDSQIANVQSLFGQVQSATQALAGQAQQIEAMHRTSEQELANRAAALVEFNSQQLAQAGENAVIAWTERLQPSLEAVGQQTVIRLGAQLEEELNTQLSRASLALGRLESQSLASDELARRLEQQLAITSTQTVESSAAHLQKHLDAMTGDFQETTRGAIQRAVSEVETKATETTHAAFESLFKTADWYEKKVQTLIQSALDKGVEQGVTELREKAGEISRVFAGELDHYSRSYVEHTQGQIEEVARESQERAKKLSQEQTVSTVYATAQQLQGKAESVLGEFQGKMLTTLGQLAAQMEQQVAQTRADVDALSRRISMDFGATIAQQAKQALGSVQDELVSQTQGARDRLRTETEESEKQLREVLASATDQGIEAYKQRLESTANSWLLTTASRLNQQSGQQLEALTRAAEARLSETCRQVFGRMGEALHRQMLDLTPAPPPAPAPTSFTEDATDQTPQ